MYMTDRVISRFFAHEALLDANTRTDSPSVSALVPPSRLRTFAEVAREKRAPKLAPIAAELVKPVNTESWLVPRQPKLNHHPKHLNLTTH